MSWHDIARPHADIRKGDFDEAVFAADLADVVAGRAPEDYNDPEVFFRKTYLTKGLEHLLRRVSEKLNTGKGGSVIELQTPFGGGKTHSLVSVWHYVTNGAQIREQLPEGMELTDAQIYSFVGTPVNPSAGVGGGSEGPTRHTLWGDIAYTLGGEDAYREIAANDEDRVSPGKDAMRPILERHQPFVLLFDELLEYVVKARGVTVGETSLGAQTLSFFKELTELVGSLPRGLMLATLPSSKLEDFGEEKMENLGKLEKVFGRLESIETPVEGEEIYSIVCQRLFETVSEEDEAAIDAVVDRYFAKYQEHQGDVPGKATNAGFKDKMRLAYPFHPDVIDLLYEKWSTFSSFQRTRGVLRLLASVVEDLYNEGHDKDLILPGDINLGTSEIRREFLKHLGEEYEGIIGSDIAGAEAKAQLLDQEYENFDGLAEAVSTGIFVHSFSGAEAENGLTRPHINLTVMRPDEPTMLISDVITKLTEQLWFLNQRDDRFYFSHVPNLNRMLRDKKEIIPERDVQRELRRRLEGMLGRKFRTYLWPDSSKDIPDNKDLKLVVSNPWEPLSDAQMKQWLERRHDRFRSYKNTVFFALTNDGRLGQVEDLLTEFKALEEIQREEAKKDERRRDPERLDRQEEIESRIEKVEENLPRQIKQLYDTIACPQSGAEGVKVHRIDLGLPPVGKENLDSWYWRELTDTGQNAIMDQTPSGRYLSAKFLKNKPKIALETLLEQFYKEPAYQVLSERAVLERAIVNAVRKGSLGVAQADGSGGIDPASVRYDEPIQNSDFRFDGDHFLLDDEYAEELCIIAEGGDEESEVDGDADGGGTVVDPPPGGGGGGFRGGQGTKEAEKEAVHQLQMRIDGVAPGQIADLFKGVLGPLGEEVDGFTFSINIDVDSEEGISKETLDSQVRETLRQLGLSFSET